LALTDVKRLLKDAGIVRNRLKVAAAIENANNFSKVKKSSEISKYMHGHGWAEKTKLTGIGP